MKIKHHEIIPNEEHPFAECKLAREPYARVLTEIVNTYADGFVLAINNGWGAGKTTFVKMWQQQLKNEGFQTIYFNAWENDFDSNPLVAIISELESLTNDKKDKVFKSVIEKGGVLFKHITPVLAKSLIKKYVVDLEDITIDTFENTTKASAEILEDEIKEYSSKKKTIIEFRKELEKFVKQGKNTKPLIFIVDELDRCRPNYSVEVLEQIKHLFSVSGIVFILSIDKNHLASAIKGFYGSEQIDSNEYLRRFIDLEYSIPKPSTKDFINYLFEYYSFKDFFSSQERLRFKESHKDSENFTLMADFLFSKSNATLRQQERIFALCRLVLCSFKVNEYTFPQLLFLLIYLKIMRVDLFQQIEQGELELQELSNSIGNLMISIDVDKKRINTGFVEALLLWLYNNNRKDRKRIVLLSRDKEGKLTSPIKSILTSENDSLVSYFETIEGQYYDNLGLDFLLKKINLTEPVTTQEFT
jgi:nucleoside-triphosphatase THEP1